MKILKYQKSRRGPKVPTTRKNGDSAHRATAKVLAERSAESKKIMDNLKGLVPWGQNIAKSVECCISCNVMPLLKKTRSRRLFGVEIYGKSVKIGYLGNRNGNYLLRALGEQNQTCTTKHRQTKEWKETTDL